MDKAVITNASREAARQGIKLAKPAIALATVQSVATDYCTTRLISLGGASSATATATRAANAVDCVAQPQEQLKVDVSYTYKTLVIGKLLNVLSHSTGTPLSTITITAHSTMCSE